MKFYILLLLIALIAVISPELVMSQPPDFPGEPDQVPIDGGLTLLAAAGGAYAYKKLRK